MKTALALWTLTGMTLTFGATIALDKSNAAHVTVATVTDPVHAPRVRAVNDRDDRLSVWLTGGASGLEKRIGSVEPNAVISYALPLDSAITVRLTRANGAIVGSWSGITNSSTDVVLTAAP